MADCGCGRGVVSKSPYTACYRTPRCHLMTPNWKVDPHRAYFCSRWGDVEPKFCPEVQDVCAPIHVPLRSLDRFSSPPMYRRYMCEPKFRYHKATFEPDPCAGSCKLSCSCCPSLPQLPSCYRPKPKPYGDVVCGMCVNNDYAKPTGLGFPCREPRKACGDPAAALGDNICEKACDMPFVVLPLFSPLQNKPTRKVSEAERCLHPSEMRYLDTNYKSDFVDFFETQTKENIGLYRGHLAIDNRRPGPKVPDQNSDGFALSSGEPIYVNARAIKIKTRGKPERKSYSVCVPGPITIGV